jgi:hypothetical protein
VPHEPLVRCIVNIRELTGALEFFWSMTKLKLPKPSRFPEVRGFHVEVPVTFVQTRPPGIPPVTVAAPLVLRPIVPPSTK